jgi:hypothetical protein
MKADKEYWTTLTWPAAPNIIHFTYGTTNNTSHVLGRFR